MKESKIKKDFEKGCLSILIKQMIKEMTAEEVARYLGKLGKGEK